jgi:hypothetical protein
MEIAPSMSCSFVVGAERVPIASLENTARRQTYHQYFLHYRMLIWRSLNVPDTTAKTQGLLTARTHGNHCIFDCRVTGLPSYTVLLAQKCRLLSLRLRLPSLAVSTCSFICRIRKSLISGGCCLVTRVLYSRHPRSQTPLPKLGFWKPIDNSIKHACSDTGDYAYSKL